MSYAPSIHLTVRDTRLLIGCVAGSVAVHLLMFTLLPRWRAAAETPPVPLTVELKLPPAIEPPTPLPIENRPPPERPKVATQAVPMKPAPPDARAIEQPRQILTASPDAPATPAAPVVPEQKPAPPPAEAPRAQAVAPTSPPPPVPPASPASPASISPPRSDAAYLSNPRPAYPLAARRRGDQGTVLVRVVVTAEGLAKSVALENTSGHPALDESALAAVKSWRFVPARQGNQAVEAPYVVPIVFKVE